MKRTNTKPTDNNGKSNKRNNNYPASSRKWLSPGYANSLLGGVVGEEQQMQLGMNTHSPLIGWQARCLLMLVTAHVHMTAPRLALPTGVIPFRMLT